MSNVISSSADPDWEQRIMNMANVACTPLAFAIAAGDDMPIPLEVVRNNSGCVVIHFFRRPDVKEGQGAPVVRMAMAEVFGAPPESMRDKDGELGNVFYRDEKKIMVKYNLPRPVLPADSWYVEFPAMYSSILADSEMLRNDLALKVKKWWAKREKLLG